VRGAYTRIVAYFTRVVRFEKVAWLELRESLSFTWKSSLFKKQDASSSGCGLLRTRSKKNSKYFFSRA
jgi:hypothetical protein